VHNILIAAVVALTAVSSGSAQTPIVPARARVEYTIVGTVTGIDAKGVSKAEVTLDAASGGPRRMQTDTAGHFTLAGLSTSTAVLHLRAFGYSPKTTTVRITTADNRAVVTISLEPLAAELMGAEVTASGADGDTKLAEYYARKTASNTFGRYIDGDDILKRKPQFVSEMLRNVPGVTLEAGSRMGNILRIRGCSPLVWVDGVRMPGAQLDELAAVQDVAGIEIYNSFAGIPARYFDRTATCGTILVWLRS
jgi:hypothetical protein